MKILHIIAFLFFCNSSFANDIDRLETNKDVNLFLIKKVDKDFKGYYAPLSETPVNDKSEFGGNTFFKIDIDRNGLTDLIICGRKLLIILDKAKDDYQAIYLDRGAFQLDKVKLISIDTTTSPRKIVIQQSINKGGQKDTLVYKFNKFIEYNSGVNNNFKFEGIKFKTSGCYGECPVFEMSVFPDRTAKYEAILFNKEKGNFSGTIPGEEFDELIEILKYIQPGKLDTSYIVNWTDDQTATVEINYNGKRKIITDYGEIGTFGLSKLYSVFFAWRKKIEWE